jgi:beta-phosphoglucomutase-like phosphatase (HAD superfamily)
MISSSDMLWDSKQYGKNTKFSRFRNIADSLRCAPKHCVVVGDAEKDMLAAKDASMTVIVVPTETTKDDDFSSADLVLPSLVDLTYSTIREILKN